MRKEGPMGGNEDLKTWCYKEEEEQILSGFYFLDYGI